MTSRERFKAALLFEGYDRPYRWEAHSFWSDTIRRWHTEGLPARIGKDDIQEYIGVEPLVYIPVTGGMTNNPYHPPFERRVISTEGGNMVISDTDGIIKKIRVSGSDDYMPQFISFPVKDRKDHEDIKRRMDIGSCSRLPETWEQLKEGYRTRTYPLGINIVGSFGYPRNLMGDEGLMYAFYDDPGLIHDILKHWLEYYIGYITCICNDITPDFLYVWEDMCYKNGPLISPEMFGEFMLPYLRELIGAARSKGIEIIILDTDGDMNKMIEPFLECGVNAFLPFEVQAGMDIVDIRKRYGKSFAIIGGLDKRVLSVSKEEIKREVEKKVPFMLEQGGYIPGIDHSCPPNIPWELFKYYIDTVRRSG